MVQIGSIEICKKTQEHLKIPKNSKEDPKYPRILKFKKKWKTGAILSNILPLFELWYCVNFTLNMSGRWVNRQFLKKNYATSPCINKYFRLFYINKYRINSTTACHNYHA